MPQALTAWRRLSWRAALAALLLLWSGMLWAAQQCTAHSGAQRAALIELYTSEGCDSCPPADQWLSRLGSGTPAAAVVPLALHVDYWDGLGWHDRFAQHRFTERQQQLSERAGSHVVYTPEVALAGLELRDWSSAAAFQAALDQVASRPSGADIELALAGGARPADLDARFMLRPGAAAAGAQAYVAVYENNLVSQVKAGENSGATLHHQYVVRQWLGPVPVVDGVARIRQALVLAPDAGGGGGAFGVAAFVQDARGDVLQALALAACP
jgi:hypothetical protein